MALSNNIRENISIEVIKVMISASDLVQMEKVESPFHEAFLNAFSNKFSGKVSDMPFFISLSSWLQGLNTTLGQTFFENVAHHLCNGEKREYTSKKLGNLKITRQQQAKIASIITNLSNSSQTPNLAAENEVLLQADETEKITAPDFSADVFFETENEVVAIELKTVKPNSGGMLGEKQKILEGKSALWHLFPSKKINFFIGFPFDPTVEPATSHNKTRFLNSIINMTKFFAPNETLVANELWNKLSGQTDTMESILEIINSISTPAFLDKFQLLTDNSKRLTPEYKNQLSEWNLFSEIELIENNNTIVGNINNDIALTRKYNKTIFDSKGNYNTERYNALKRFF